MPSAAVFSSARCWSRRWPPCGKTSRLRTVYPRLVYLTGWILFGLILVLTAYNVRKKLAFLPLFSSRTWFQIHVYTGLFTGLAFLLHLRWRLPSGLV